jgi:hypothetical protein
VETIIGVAIWVAIFLIWYYRTYPERLKAMVPFHLLKIKWPRARKVVPVRRASTTGYKDFKTLVEAIEQVCSRDHFGSSDAALMVEAVKQLMELEPGSAQIWEAYALDSLETATINCDECHTPVEKTVKKTGIKISCRKCGKWLALKNSKVTVIDPNRRDLEDWER